MPRIDFPGFSSIMPCHAPFSQTQDTITACLFISLVMLAFWRKYLAVYNYVESGGQIPGTYIQNSRRVHSQSMCGPAPLEIAKILRSPPSAPSFNEGGHEDVCRCENGDSSVSNNLADHCRQDPALRCLSDLEEIRDLAEVTLTPEQEEALILESTYGALFSHLWWTVWALIQTQISSFEFGFIDRQLHRKLDRKETEIVEYAESRMTAYYNLKKTLPASEFPNGENQCPDVPSLRKINEELFTIDSSSRVHTNGDSKKSSSNFYVEEDEVDS
ncbi:hypothetical protein ACTXT7_011719 [Hymenolepis weldensis]